MARNVRKSKKTLKAEKVEDVEKVSSCRAATRTWGEWEIEILAAQ